MGVGNYSKRGVGAVTRAAKLMVERLEQRTMLDVTPRLPAWSEQGPAPFQGSVTIPVPGGWGTGAIEAIATPPHNASIVFAGTVNGGVWRTQNGTVGGGIQPSWQPLSGALASLSVGAIALSHFDSTGTIKITKDTPAANVPFDKLVVYFGTAKTSSGAYLGGPRTGLYKSSNGGRTWQRLDPKTFAGLDIRSIVPSETNPNTILVAAQNTGKRGGGVYLSTDGGKTFTRVLKGNVTHLVSDPANGNRFYAGMAGNGVFRNTTGGSGTWTQVNSGLNSILNDGVDDDRDGKAGTAANPEPDESVAKSRRVELSVHNSTNNNVVYCLMTGTSDKIMGVWRSTDQGANWTQMPTAGLPAGTALPNFNPGAQADHHLAILADRNNPNVVFVSGDQRPSVWRADIAANPVWVNMSGAAANNTNPHSDSRDMVFNAAGDILQADDGGIYRLFVPNNDIPGVTRQWDSRLGNLRVSEFDSAAYDSVNKTMFGGLQDNGVVEQARGAGLFNPWKYVANGGDGTVVQVVNTATTSTHYSTTQNFGSFERRVYDNAGNPPTITKPTLTVSGAAGRTLTGPGSWSGKFDSTFPFTTQYAINSVPSASSRILVGSAFLYESTNGGNTFTSLGGVDLSKVGDGRDDDRDGVPDTAASPDNDEVEVLGNFGEFNATTSSFGRITAMAYGGRSGGTDEADVAYVAAGRKLAVRPKIQLGGLADFTTIAAYKNNALKAGNIRDIAIDPEEWKTGWVVDDKGQVFAFKNSGNALADWTNITGNLKKFTYGVHSVEVIRTTKAPNDFVVLVGGINGVYAADTFAGANTVWRKVGTGLPPVNIKDLRYDKSDVLTVGTWGRGAWNITAFLTKFYPAGAARASLSALSQDQAQASPLEPMASGEFVGPLTSLAYVGTHASFVGPVVLSEPQIVPAELVAGDPGVLEITGDGLADKNDIIRLVLDPANPDMLQVFVNNTSEDPDAVLDVDAIQKVFVTGGEGADQLVIDQANGLIKFAEGISFTDFVSGVDSQQEINFTPIDSGVVSKIRKGLAGLASWANKLSQVSEAAQKLPAIGVSLSDLFKVGDGSGAIGGVLQQGLVDRLSQYFTSDVTPTVQELVDRIKSISAGVGDVLFGIDPSSVLGALTNDNGHQELRFDLALNIDAFRDELTLDFGADAESLGLHFDADAKVNLSAKLNLDFAFGVDLAPGLSDEQAFFVQVDDLSLNARVSAGAPPVHLPVAHPEDEFTDGTLDLSLKIGFLEAQVKKGSVVLDGTLALAVNNPDDDPLGHITLEELAGTSLSTLLDVSADGTLDINLPLHVSLAGIGSSAQPVIKITSDDLFGTLPTVTTEGFDQLLDFNNISADDVLSLLKQLITALNSFRSSSVFSTEIPFTDTSLGDVLDVATALNDKLITPLTSGDSTSFSSAQELGKVLAEALGLDPDFLDVQYDPATQELTYQVALSHTFAPKPVKLALDASLAPIAGFEAGATIDLEAGLAADFIFGIDLSPLGADETLLDRFFVQDASFRATLGLSAEDIEAFARVGFIGIGVDGGKGELLASASFQLQNPNSAARGSNDAQLKLTLADLKKGLANPTSLLRKPKVVTSSLGANVNVTKQHGNQNEAVVAIDPTHPDRVVVLALSDDPRPGISLSIRQDNGTWVNKTIGTGPKVTPDDTDHDGLPLAGPDPAAVFDRFGNLYLAFMNTLHNAIEVVVSTDHCQTFKLLKQFDGVKWDRPWLATGPSGIADTESVWICFRDEDPAAVNPGIYAAGALVTLAMDIPGSGILTSSLIGQFSPLALVPGSLNGNFPSMSVGPKGQLMIAFANASATQPNGPTTLHTVLDPDGLRPDGNNPSKPFGSLVLAANTEVGPNEAITPQPERKITPAPSIAYDVSGRFPGRAYMVYTDHVDGQSSDTNIHLLYSDSDGAQGTWKKVPKPINKDTAGHSQFFPALAVDPKSGYIIVTWYDTRNDAASRKVEFFGAISTDGGASFKPVGTSDGKISAGKSDEDLAEPPLNQQKDLDFGDYTSVAFYDKVAWPIWADNSNSTNDNPDGAKYFDVYTAKVTLTETTAGARGVDAPTLLADTLPFELSGSLDLTLPVTIDAGITLPISSDAAVEIHWADMTKAFDPATDLTFPDLGDVLNFKDVSFAQIVEAFQKLVDYLDGVSKFGFLKEKLPLINRSVSDLLHAAGDLGDKVAGFQEILTVQKLKDEIVRALDLDPADVEVMIDPADKKAISVDVKFQPLGFHDNVNLNFDLASLLDQAVDSPFVDMLTNIANISGNGQLKVDADATFDLHFGIDTSGTIPVPFLYDDTDASVSAQISTVAPLTFDANILVLSAKINGGTMGLHSEGNPNQPASFTLAMAPDNTDHRYTLDELIPPGGALSPTNFNVTLDGAGELNLPFEFPAGTSIGALRIRVPELDKLLGGEDNAVIIDETPNFAQIIDDFDLLNNLDSLIDGLDKLLALLQGALDSSTFAQNLPLVGSKMKDGANVIEQFRSEVIGRLKTLFNTTDPKNVDFVKAKLAEALGPILLDGPDEGTDVSANDIAALVTADDVRFDFKIGYDPAAKPVDFDLALPGLGLSASGDVNVDMGFSMDVGLGLDKTHGVYLRTDTADELKLNFNVNVASFDASASFLGLLRIDAVDKGSSFGGNFNVDLHDDDGKLTFAELGAANLTSTLNAGANINVHLNGAFGTGSAFPSVAADLLVQWGFGSSPLPHSPVVALNNVELDAGSFFNDFILPVVVKIQKVVAPFESIIEFLEKPLPAISKISKLKELFDADHDGKITVLDLAVKAKSVPPNFQEFINAFHHVFNLIDLIGGAADASGKVIKLGNVPLGSVDFRQANAAASVNIPTQANIDAAQQLQNAGAPGAASFIRTSLQSAPGGGFQIPLLSQPSILFKLLMGQSDVNLFTYDMPKLNIGISYRQSIPIGSVGVATAFVVVRAGLDATIDLGFGYDTKGLRLFKQTKQLDDLLDGIYASDRTNADGTGDERPELEIGGKISVGIGGSVAGGLLGGDVSVGVDASVKFDLAGEPSDGKVKIVDLDDECVFDITGDLTIFLEETVSVAWGLYEDSSRQDLYSLDLAFHECIEGAPAPALAHISTGTGGDIGIEAGTLILNMGRFAHLRGAGSSTGNTDEDELFNIIADPDVPGGVLVSAYGFTQGYSGFTKIHGEGGKGNDKILIDGSVTATCELHGDHKLATLEGFGDDVLQSGNGNALIFGGEGNDQILTGNGNDTALGGDGNDIIELSNGNDSAVGGEGDDKINVGDGVDTALGGNGNDLIYGMGDADSITGGNGTDTVFAGGGNDTVEGNVGDDHLFGNEGNDSIVGAAGADIISGNDGDDKLSGDADADNISGDAGQDSVEGGDGDDILAGGADNDTVTGGTGKDAIDGNAGNDSLQGDADSDTVHGGAGSDKITGNDAGDFLFGDEDNDDISGDAGDDSLEGGTGNDKLRGGAGVDTLRGQEDTDDLDGQGDGDNVFGDAGNDVAAGGSGNDFVHGGTEDDQLNGNDGEDFVYGNAGNDTASGDGDNDQLFGQEGNDSIHGNAGNDTATGSVGNDIMFGDEGADSLSGNEDNDLIFGDRGQIDPTQPANVAFISIATGLGDGGGDDFIDAGSGDDTAIGGQGADNILGGEGDDDLMGGHNVAGGADGNDTIDGGAGNDAMAGDNAKITRRHVGLADPIVRALLGGTIYTLSGAPNIGPAQVNPNGVVGRDFTFYDHASTTAAGLYGNDVIAGGAGADSAFGQLGNDAMQGDGNVTLSISATSPSVSASTDADDYMEGGGGNDLMFGNGGQDDLIGGSSSLFGLTNATQRPDGADTIFGGAGLALGLGSTGDATLGGHARDADVIIGDNGNIYRVLNTAKTAFAAFNYDDYAGTLRIIPRAVEVLDVSSDDVSSNDIGAGDLIHGEAGDDTAHGAAGNDSIFGEGQDDDLIGGTGDDFIAGGTGDDGVLGDDGRIFTSRNGKAEPLYGIAAVTQSTVTTKSINATAILNPTGQLSKSVDLEPFNAGGADLIYGGLGNDSLHGGGGQDAISGAEALAPFYNNPAPAGLSFSGEKFALFNYNTPLAKIANHPLNFDATLAGVFLNDGDDKLFGDGGNDWLVGGTGTDNLFGGMGNDILNTDDNLDTTAEDTGNFIGADLAFGGGGRDILIANAPTDRLADWVGEFNNYYVPFSPFGQSTILRLLSPGVPEFLYAVSKSDGADQTRVGAGLGSAARNGEPFGELGLVIQSDPEWGAQNGPPVGPQPQ